MNKFIIILIFIFFLISAPASAKSHHRKHHQTRHHIHHIVAKTKPPAIPQPTQNGTSPAKKEPATFNQESFDSTEPNSPYSQEALPTEEEIESYFPREGEEWPEVQPEEE